ncbi:molybdopterin-dependent oxidoreductase [Thermatribacter velox]|uniref:Molybdopterin-dependent oxidoreductase n=1 Tax=Thermatribacter velox TaxID=3039681 RepID=A0ABZ2Y8V4_9BACT
MQKLSRAFTVLALSLFFVLVFVVAGFGEQNLSTDEVEIREYQGEKLGSVSDFRENSIRGVQKVDPATYRLVVDGLVAKPLSFSLEELRSFPRKKKLVTLFCVEGWQVKALWEGIPLSALFEKVGVLPEANTVIFYAVDGYTTSLPLDYILERDIIIADKINGITLPPAQGFPFQLVAESKWGYKWIRWLERIELSDNANYRGYWESKGYSNSGDLNRPMFEQ